MKPTPFLLERYFAQHEFTAKFLLSSSDCESMTLEELLRLEPEAEAHFKKLWLGYTESLGNPELRTEISKMYRMTAAEKILVHAGAQEAIFNLMNVLLDPKDHVIIQFPCYQSVEELPKALGCSVTRWSPTQALPWAWKLEELQGCITPHTKLLVINNPHNPTGYLMPKEFYKELLSLVQERGIYLLSDEVYYGLEYDEAHRLEPACDLYERAISLGVLSKSFGLAGLRLGWIATQDDKLFQQMANFKDYTTICTSAPSEFLATLGLRQKAFLWKRNQQLITSNLMILNEFFHKRKALLQWTPPLAGCIGFPKLQKGLSATLFSERLLKDSGVLLVPSSKFNYGDAHLRFGFGRMNFAAGLRALDTFLTNSLP